MKMPHRRTKMPDNNPPASWRKVQQSEQFADPIENDRVIRAAKREHDQASNPKGFAVFIGTAFDNTKPSESFRVYYFSPDASVACQRALTSLRAEECEPPSSEKDSLSLAVGDEETAWDLL